MNRIVLSEDCKIVGFETRNPRPPGIPYGEVLVQLVMPVRAEDTARIPVPASVSDAIDDVNTKQRYRLVLEPID